MAAVAMTASVFAVDFQAAIKASTNLFGMTFANGAKPTMLEAGLDSGGAYWGSRLQANIYGDRCSAQFALSYHSWDSLGVQFGLNDYKVTFDPFAALSVQILNADDKMNESYTDQKKVMGAAGAWKATIKPVDGLAIDVTLPSKWMDAGNIGSTSVKVGYSADFGTISAMMIANNNFKAMRLGAGFAGKAGEVAYFADAAIDVLGSVANLAVDAQADANIDTINVKAYVLYENSLNNSQSLLLRAKASMALDGATAYCEIKDDNLMGPFAMTVNPGVGFKVGGADLDLGLKLEIGSAVAVSVPFSASVSF